MHGKAPRLLGEIEGLQVRPVRRPANRLLAHGNAARPIPGERTLDRSDGKADVPLRAVERRLHALDGRAGERRAVAVPNRQAEEVGEARDRRCRRGRIARVESDVGEREAERNVNALAAKVGDLRPVAGGDVGRLRHVAAATRGDERLVEIRADVRERESARRDERDIRERPVQKRERRDAAGLLGREELENLQPHLDRRRDLRGVHHARHNRQPRRLGGADDLRIESRRDEKVRTRLLRGGDLRLGEDRPRADRHVGMGRADRRYRLQRPWVAERDFNRADAARDECVGERNGRSGRGDGDDGQNAGLGHARERAVRMKRRFRTVHTSPFGGVCKVLLRHVGMLSLFHRFRARIVANAPPATQADTYTFHAQQKSHISYNSGLSRG